MCPSLVRACVAIIAGLTDSRQLRTHCYLWFVCHDNSQHNVLLAQACPVMLKQLPSYKGSAMQYYIILRLHRFTEGTKNLVQGIGGLYHCGDHDTPISGVRRGTHCDEECPKKSRCRYFYFLAFCDFLSLALKTFH